MSKNESEPGFWNGLSLSFVAGLRVVDAVRSDDGSWYTVAKGMRVHLAKDDDDFRELVRRAVAWKKAQTAPIVYEPPSTPIRASICSTPRAWRAGATAAREGASDDCRCVLPSGHSGIHQWSKHEPTNPECPICGGACDFAPDDSDERTSHDEHTEDLKR